jgi:hypothetical protein
MFRRRFIITIGDSRVGKSTVSRLLLELYKKHELNIRAFYHGYRPGDLSNKLSVYDKLGFNIRHLGLNRGDSDLLLNELEVFSEIDLALTDMPGQNLLDFFRFEKEIYFLENLNSLGYRATFIHPISNRRDCVEYLRSLYHIFGNRGDYLVVKNQYFSDFFKYYDGTHIQEDINNLSGVELILPKLEDYIYQDLEDTKLPYKMAIIAESDMQVLYRSVVFNWMENFYDTVMNHNIAPVYLGLKRDRTELTQQEATF